MNDSASTSTYLMESPREGQRLETKTRVSAARSQLKLAGLRPGMHALDVGCGTGAVTRVMAAIAGPGRVVGVDASAERIAQAEGLAGKAGAAISFSQGDALALDLSNGAFDLTWSRFLFEYLAAPERALAEMVRVTRPGGIVAVADLDGQLAAFDPLDDETRAQLDALLVALRTSGFDPDVGRRLYGWFVAAGLADIHVHVMPHQVYAGGIPADERLNWRQKVATAVPKLLAIGDIAACEHITSRFLAMIERDDLFYYSTLILVTGRVPGGGPLAYTEHMRRISGAEPRRTGDPHTIDGAG